MRIFQRKSPIEKEWGKLMKEEDRFLAARTEKKDSFLNRKLEEVVPEKMQGTLDAAFAKAFGLIFEKGTGVIEKTYKKEELEKEYKINQYTEEVRQDSKSLKRFSKKAKQSGGKNMIFSGAAGIGMGVLGIGIPDIPIFLGMVLKSIYEIALNFGFRYDTEEEKYLILLVIRGAVSYGDEMLVTDRLIREFMERETLPVDYDRESQIRRTSEALSKELLYMKFLQGVPVVGAVGGAYDAVYMRQITVYANLIYRHRFLMKKKQK